MKHQTAQQLDANNITGLVESLYEPIDILKSEVYFFREEKTFISQWHNKLARANLKKDILVEMEHQIAQQLDAHSTTDLVKSLYEQIDILKSEVHFF